jgi:hypothetical protein
MEGNPSPYYVRFVSPKRACRLLITCGNEPELSPEDVQCLPKTCGLVSPKRAPKRATRLFYEKNTCVVNRIGIIY